MIPHAWLEFRDFPNEVVDMAYPLDFRKLRDQHGICSAKCITDHKVLRILKQKGLASSIPEDLYYLIKKAVEMRKHLGKHRQDTQGKFKLILLESRIHRVSRYHKANKQLPANWKYDSSKAAALV